MLRLASLAVLLTFAPLASAQLAGTYTIDGSAPTAGTNYQTFADATAALAAQGVSAAVTFEVAAGTYNEQVTIPAVAGVSSSRRVTFQGPATGALPQIRATAPSAAADWVVGVESRYVTLERLRMTVGNPFQPLGTVVSISAAAEFAFVLDSETVSNGGAFATGIAAGVLSQTEVSLIQGVTSSGGTHGVVVAPPAGTVHDKSQHALWDLTISDVRDRGILVERQDNPGQSLAIQRTTVTQTSSEAGFVGIEVADLTGRSVLTENRVQIDDGTGVRLAGIDEGASGTTVVVNTMVTVGGSGVAMDVADVGSLVFQSSTLYNSFQSFPVLRLDALSAGAELRNLILSRRGGGSTMEAPGGVAALDHVVFDTESRSSVPFQIDWDGTTYTDAITFEAAEAAATAIGAFPVEYVATGSGDLHLTGTSDGDGRLVGVLAGVLEDIDGDARDAQYPYVGADEAPTALVPIPPALAGTYTLDPSQPATLPNFTSFGAFLSALRNQGVSAPVELQVVSGTHFSSTFSSYPGASALRPVSIVPAAGATAPLTINAQTFFIAADHVTLDGVTMRDVRVEGASGVSIVNGVADEIVSFVSSDVIIEGNEVEGVEVLSSTNVLVQDNDITTTAPATTQGVYGVFVRQAVDVALRDNVVSGAQYGIWVEAALRPVVEGNDVTVPDDSDEIGAGIYVGRYTPSPSSPSQYSEDSVVRGNRIELGVRRRTFQFRPYGINVPFIRGTAQIEGNQVTVASEANGIKAGAHSATGNVTIANNIVKSDQAPTFVYTRFNDLLPPVLLAHNTLLGGATVFSDGVTILGNIIFSTSGSTPLFMSSFTPAAMDYNVLATTGSVLFSAGGTAYADLAAIQAGTPYEANGSSFFPEFVDPFAGDLHLFGSSLGDARLAAPRLPGVLTDLDGDARPETTYRGADEVAGSPLPPLTADVVVTALLQGAMSSGTMRTDLRDADLVPLGQPFSAAPLSYAGTEVTTPAVLAANAVVDWVLIELRATFDGPAVERVAALLLAGGSVLAADGAGPPEVSAMGDHFVVVRHRNHLAAMTATAVPLGAADLTAGVYGLGGTEVSPGVWALTAGDADGDGSVLAGDRQSVWLPAVGQSGYVPADMNLDGSVLADDRQSFWTPNVGSASQVPGAASLTGDRDEDARGAVRPAAARTVRGTGASRGTRE